MSDIQGAAAGVAAELIDVAGTPTALRRAGEGPPLLFLHGAGFTGAWLPFHEALSEESDLLAPEHVGFGDTPMQDWMRSIDDMLVHYDDFVRELQLDRFDLVGYSLGGWIAARYAVLWPERVRTLTLIVPAGLRLPGTAAPPDLFLTTPEQTADLLFEDKSKIDEVFSLPEGVDPIDAATKMYAQMSAIARLGWNPRHDRSLPRLLRRITAPTLLVGAENDRVIPDENAVGSYGQFITHARTTHIPGTGHALVIEQPEVVAQAVLDFVKESA